MALAAIETLPGGPRQTSRSWHTAVVKKIDTQWWKDDGTLEGQMQAQQVRSLLFKTNIEINEVSQLVSGNHLWEVCASWITL